MIFFCYMDKLEVFFSNFSDMSIMEFSIIQPAPWLVGLSYCFVKWLWLIQTIKAMVLMHAFITHRIIYALQTTQVYIFTFVLHWMLVSLWKWWTLYDAYGFLGGTFQLAILNFFVEFGHKGPWDIYPMTYSGHVWNI